MQFFIFTYVVLNLKKMTTFSRYYNSQKELIEVSMDEINELIKIEANKSLIAEYVYERLYTRFLKIFDFESTETAEYTKHNKKISRNIFSEEYKNGFIQMASCSLLVETFAAFLTGENETPRGQATNRFKKVFEYAESKNNQLKIFKARNDFYGRIRCGILHQGETKGNYTISREGINLLKDDEIDAFLFHKFLKNLLQAYKEDLKANSWDDMLWDSCRQKIRHIVNNGL